jgi:glycosyltransferase involved in cell wall biosynthesis
VRERIFFVGEVAGREKALLLMNATAFVLPSYSENFGNVVLEAMAAGCPVVVTPEVGLADTVRDTGAGIVVEGVPTFLGPALQGVLADPEAARQMGIRGKQAVADRFSWPVVAQEMEDLYHQTLAGKGDSDA